jgi:hypothetical protein
LAAPVVTRQGKIRWRAASDEEGFFYSAKTGTVLIRSKDRDGSAPYILSIFNSEGTEVESVSSEDDPFYDLHEDFDRLYVLARRSGLKVDVIIADFLRDLRQEQPDAEPNAQEAPSVGEPPDAAQSPERS